MKKLTKLLLLVILFFLACTEDELVKNIEQQQVKKNRVRKLSFEDLN